MEDDDDDDSDSKQNQSYEAYINGLSDEELEQLHKQVKQFYFRFFDS